MFHIIDDDATILEILKEIIASEGYKTNCFESGEHYLEYFHSAAYKNPIAILSDVNMPGITGHEMAQQIRQTHTRQKIVFITGKADAMHQQVSRKLHCYSLDKPFQPKRLITLLHALSACEKSSSEQGKNSYLDECELAIEFGCPFSQSSQDS